MNVSWDYTKLAASYVKRPDYAANAIDEMLTKLNNPQTICDVGAGDGHLTIELAKRDKIITAVEPNDAMRGNGIDKTAQYQNVNWAKGTGEETAQDSNRFDAVTFGSSFNVCDQMRALAETKRICKPGGGFACLWNHRDLEDPIQMHIESIIKRYIPQYDYGNRRQDQTEFLNRSGYLKDIAFISGHIVHEQPIDECIEAWRSHGTLHRQCDNDDMFHAIIDDIAVYLIGLHTASIKIPYVTRVWTGILIEAN